MGKEDLILREIKKALKDISEGKSRKLVKEIVDAKKISVIGHGRSWHVAKSFAMRLKHLGLDVGNVGNKNLTIVLSGSGETKDILKIVKKIKKGRIICITAQEDSHIAKEADLIIEVRARRSKQPMRSLFEQSALVYLDGIVIKLMKELKISEKEMWKKHD